MKNARSNHWYFAEAPAVEITESQWDGKPMTVSVYSPLQVPEDDNLDLSTRYGGGGCCVV